MQNRVIYIKSDEEITSIIDKLVKLGDKEIFLVVPEASVLAQSLVNLKLLKREADSLGKKITVVSQDPALQRLAKKADFLIGDSLASDVQQAEPSDLRQTQPEEPEPEEPVLHAPIPADKFEGMLKEERRPSPLRVADIVKDGIAPRGRLIAEKARLSQNEPRIKELNENQKVVERIFKKTEPEEKDSDFQAPLGSIGQASGGEIVKADSRYDFLRSEEASRESQALGLRGISAKGKELANPDELFISSFPGKIFALFIVSALVIAVLVSFLILPKADVSIAAKRQNLPFDIKVSVDKNLAQPDLAEGKIPGQLLRLEEKTSQEFSTTGQRQLNEKSRGTITVYNGYSSAPQTLIETTRFVSAGGLIFRLTKTVTIPGAKIEEGRIVPSFIDVAVEADQPGGEYNIGPASFTIPGFKGSPKYEGFYGKSKNDMSGGSTENVRVLTRDDFDSAKTQILESLKQKINDQLQTQIPAGFTLLKDAVLIEMSQAQPTVAIGEKAEKFSVSAKGTARALIFSEENILLILKNKLITGPEQKEISGKRALSFENIMADLQNGRLSFQAKGEQEIIWKINPDELKAMIAGKDEAQVRQILADRPEISEAQFSLWPFWVKKIPAQKEKIKIAID